MKIKQFSAFLVTYVDFLEAELGVPIKLVSTGPKRHENAVRRP